MNETIGQASQLLRRIRWLTALFIVGLVVSGATAIPVETELAWLARLFGVNSETWAPWDNGLRGWIHYI